MRANRADGPSIPAAIILLLGILSGCSSLPPRPDEITTIRNRVAQYTEYGDTYYRRGQYEQARGFYDLALAHARSVDSLEQVATIHNALGQSWHAEGDLQTARDHFEYAQRIAERSGSDRLQAESRSNQGKLAVTEGNYEEGRRLLHEALDMIGTNRAHDRSRAVILHNLGTALAGAGELDQARERLDAARSLNERGNHRIELASNYYMLASIESRSGNFDVAMDRARRALEIDRAMENSRGIVADLRALSMISLRRDRPAEAFEYLDRAYEVAAGASDRPSQIVILEELIPLAESLNRAQDSARYRRLLEEL